MRTSTQPEPQGLNRRAAMFAGALLLFALLGYIGGVTP